MPSIAQNLRTEAIAAPDSAQSEIDDVDSSSSPPTVRSRSARAVRVVGSLEHAILPMPPVCLPSTLQNWGTHLIFNLC
jgi:hypothetical protein